MKADKKRKERQKQLATRRGLILIVSLAVLILLVNIISASFSWFAPKSVTNAGAQYTETTFNRSEQCTFTTYQGTINESFSAGHYIGQIEYNTAVTHVSIEPNDTVYFRTSIINSDTKYASNVSLYFASVGEAGSNLTFAVTFPSNTVRSENGQKTDYCLVRNAYVKVHDANDVDGPGLLQVDWFVKNDGASAVTLNLDPESAESEYSNMYLMYN